MWTSKFWNSVVVTLLLALSVSPAMAQKKPGPPARPSIKQKGAVQVGAGGGQQNQKEMQQAIQQIGQQLQEGEKVLEEASTKAAEVRQAWQAVDAEHKQNMREVAQAKKFAEDEAKNSPELKAAKGKLDGLRGELAEIRI